MTDYMSKLAENRRLYGVVVTRKKHKYLGKVFRNCRGHRVGRVIDIHQSPEPEAYYMIFVRLERMDSNSKTKPKGSTFTLVLSNFENLWKELPKHELWLYK